MDGSQTLDISWSEADSEGFIQWGEIVTPDRDQIRDAILGLVPAQRAEAFRVVEIGIGAGWLSEAILDSFPHATVLGLDGSPTMLRQSSRHLERFGSRVELRQFRLEDSLWVDEVGSDVRCFVSSLVIHHLDGPAKQRLYRSLYNRLTEPGALLVADLVAPLSERERAYMAEAWDRAVERQALAMTGAPEVYRRFAETEWNWFRYPDPVDMPSTIPEHLGWLGEAGFAGANVFWARAGHAVYGGFRE